VSIETQLERLLPSRELGHFAARDGLPDLPLVAPQSEAGMAEFLRAAATDGWKLVVVGNGSKLSWYPAPANVDVILSSARLSGVSAYEPEDGTLSAWAGTPLLELEETVRAGGHHLSPEVPRPESATLGGVVASASSGFDRLRYGAVRENVLGLRVALPDGKVVKSGGRLVKNVTGYDLHRLLCGSHGTLGVITEVSLRLYPWPVAAGLLSASYATREEALSKARKALACPVHPVAIVVSDLGPGESHRLELFLAGREDVIEFLVCSRHT